MGEYSRHHLYTVDLNKPLKRHYMGLLLAEGDVQGDILTSWALRRKAIRQK